MRQLAALSLAGAFVVGVSTASFACEWMKSTTTASSPTKTTVATADQAAPSTKVTIPSAPKSGS